MGLRRAITVVALIGFLLAGGLGGVAPLTVCSDETQEAHLATPLESCCPTENVPPSETAAQVASAEGDCCLDLTDPADQLPAKPQSAPDLLPVLAIPAVIQPVFACPSIMPPPLPADPPVAPAGVLVLRC